MSGSSTKQNSSLTVNHDGGLYESDFTHWPLATGKDTEILTFLDDHARFVISITAHTTVTGAIVLERFRAAIDTYGIPESTLTDNAMGFTTR